LTSDEEGETQDILKNGLEQLLSNLIDCLVYSDEDEEEEEASSDDEDDDEDEEFRDETLREIASNLVETISSKFGAETFQKAQTKLSQSLLNKDDDWHSIESAVLYIGIIAPEAFDPDSKDSQDILQPLAPLFQHSEAQVKTTVLWTLSQVMPCLIK